MNTKRRIAKVNLQKANDLPWVVVSFKTCLNKAKQVEDEILSACTKSGYGEHDIFALKLALEEALVNAVKHGNKLDPCKCVKVQYRITPQRADVTIEDEGPGFNPADVPDPTCEENLELNHGRGLLLMRAYMSSVVFNPSGNKVAMTKFNDAGPSCPTVASFG